MNSNLVANNLHRGSYIPLFSLNRSILAAFILMLISSSLFAQTDTAQVLEPNFRVPVDIAAISSVFNQENINATQDSGEMSYQSLPVFKEWKSFRRTRVITLPTKVWQNLGDTMTDGDVGMYRKRVVKESGRLITATEKGIWIYQNRDKRVVYFPYDVIELVKSGSSTGRTMYLAAAPVVAELAIWLSLDASGADIYGSDNGLIGGVIVFLTGATDLLLWNDYMGKKSTSPLCKLRIHGDSTMGATFKKYAEGGHTNLKRSAVDILFSNRGMGGVNLFPRNFVRRTSLNPLSFPSKPVATMGVTQ